MPTEYAGRGDPARTIELLWGTRERGARGPKPALTVDQIAAAAIELADADGLAGLSMRRVADRLGVGTMSLKCLLDGIAVFVELRTGRLRPSSAPSALRR